MFTAHVYGRTSKVIRMVDPLSPIYSELWWLQIHEFQDNLKKWCNSGICNHHNLEYIGLRGLTMQVKVAQNEIFSKIRKFDSSQMNLVDLFYCNFIKIN